MGTGYCRMVFLLLGIPTKFSKPFWTCRTSSFHAFSSSRILQRFLWVFPGWISPRLRGRWRPRSLVGNSGGWKAMPKSCLAFRAARGVGCCWFLMVFHCFYCGVGVWCVFLVVYVGFPSVSMVFQDPWRSGGDNWLFCRCSYSNLATQMAVSCCL